MAISVPYTFTAGNTILSAEVNSNFSTVAAAALNKSGDTISGNITVNSGITIDGVDLSVDVAKVGSTATVTGVWTFSTSPVFSAAVTLPSAVITAGATVGTSLTVGTTLGVSGLSTLAGAQFADTTLQRPIIKDFAETRFSAGNTGTAITFDCENGNTQTCTATGNFTATFSNPPASSSLGSLLIIMTQDGTVRTATWPASVKWPSALAPTLTGTLNKIDIFHFITVDGGTSWYASVVGQNL